MTHPTWPTDLGTADLNWLLPLNRRHEVELSPLTRTAMASMIEASFYARGVPDAAFLFAFDQDGAYDSPNFLWFKQRLPRFIYVDRIAVAAASRGRGLARRLYEDLFGLARRAHYPCVVCEVNTDPPNPASDAFHARLGFEEVGTAHLADRGKHVRYLSLAL